MSAGLNYFGTPKPICLFIAAMKDENSAARERYNDVFNNIVIRAADLAKMEPRQMLSNKPGMIVGQIFTAINDAKLVIADLSDDNT